jgi:dipeptidyl aminopeptidase/acylaminoacyl peptidase
LLRTENMAVNVTIMVADKVQRYQVTGLSLTTQGTMRSGVRPVRALAIFLALLFTALGSAVGKPFTVAEEIGLAHFGDPYTGQAESTQFSPDGRYFAALTERGRIDLNRPEDTLRIYRTEDVLSVLVRAEDVESPTPLWGFNRSTDMDGPLITHWRWLKDSSGIAFLERGAHGSNRLVLADLKTKTVKPLTPEGESIKAFDIRDREHYVYAVADPGLLQRAAAEGQAAAIVGTGRTLSDLLFPVNENPQMASFADRSELWAVVGGQPFQVKDHVSDQALVLFSQGQRLLALSPDGGSLVTVLAVAEIPSAWERLYPPPYAASPFRLHAGKQDLATFSGYALASRYVQIDLRSARVRALGDGPTSLAVGLFSGASPAWSEDGKSIVLPNFFVAPNTHGAARACIAVVRVSTAIPSCVEPVEGPDEHGSYEKSHAVTEAHFVDAAGERVVLTYYERNDSRPTTEYRRTAAGNWAVAQRTVGADRARRGDLQVTVHQGLNAPPVMAATSEKSKASWVIWDPNPQLKDIALGEATVFRWKDKTGREWKGGLFKPVPYEAGRRYPLVIQTHGFSETAFESSGIYPTSFAARALASAGLVVLQANMCPIFDTPEEGPCNVDGYESAVSELVKEGLVDSERVGIIGFSRTCFHAMEALTTSTLHIKAASITDGVMGDYLQYVTNVDVSGFSGDADAIIGARPFAEGLQLWLKRSPLFNMDKMSAALQVVAEGRSDLTFMWEPYAAMRYLHKPVDLILLANDQHVLSNPAARMISQGGSVDWFRFWLKDEEDSDPAKAEQYKRWRELRKLQHAQDPNAEKVTAGSPIL